MSMSRTPAPPQAKAATGASPDKSADATIADLPPDLANMAPVVWEETLSFLPPAGIATMSYRISKTLCADEDKADSPDKAAKLALESMMSVAWSEPEEYYMYDGVAANDDYIDADDDFDQLRTIPLFEDESSLRTYVLGTTMLRVGERKRDEMIESGDIAPVADDIIIFPLCVTMWLLYGRPALPPMSEVGTKIASAMLFCMFELLIGAEWIDTKENRLKIKDAFKKFSRRRILIVLERMGKIGLFEETARLLTMLAFNRPQCVTENMHIYQAEYFVDARVGLKGLSRTELNGKDGIVEKEYNHTNGRIGVALVDEATGDRRVIGVKPINLDLLEEDSHFVIDTKVLLAEILCRCLFVRQNCTLPWLPTVLHMLRGIVATLCMKFDNADNDLFAGEDVHSNTFLYSSDVHRLVFAENYLGFLLSFFAKYIAMRMVPIDFGGLVCRRYDDVLEMLNYMPAGVDDEERKMGEVLFISQFYMEEAVKVLARSEKHVEWLRENNKKESDGEIILMNALVSGTLHEIAGVSSKGLEFAMVPLNKRDTRSLIGERAEQNAKDHLMVAIAFLRTQFESLMHAYVDLKEDDGPLTVRTFCSNDTFPQFFPVTLIYLLHTITEIFVETGAMWTEDFFPNGESEDKTMLITFALFVSTNSLGLGHPMTKRVGFLYEKISGDASWGVGRNSNFDELESSVNVWLESYAPLYFNTSRQHPALYCQLADLDPPDFLQDITS